MGSAVGYQPTLATDMGTMQERITTTKKGSITSVQAIYVPADDLTDPAPPPPLRTWTPPPSCPSPSRSLRCSPTTLASSSPLLRPSPDSRRSLLASSITCPRV